jgi:flagellar motility protein MotE (MotC chaperone)
MREYENKFDALELREQRLKVAQEVAKQDIDKLDNLRIDIASMIARLKEQQDKLLKVRVEIAEVEKANLISVAATYDKMDPASASRILTTMSKTSRQTPGQDTGLDEAVKILYYMTERTKAKLLAELVSSEPALAATLCQRLKQVR